MSERRLYLDDAPGERRGVVALHGLPERLLIHRDDDLPTHQPQAQLVARVRRIERSLAMAFLDLGAEPDAMLPLTGAARSLAEGAWIVVEIVSPPRRGKGPVARLIGPGQGPARLLTPAPDLRTALQAFAPDASILGGDPAREAADLAEEAALRIAHPLPGGGRIVIEPTQALTAVDVDLAASGGEARQALARANRQAITAAARLLRLKGLGGLVAIDLAGKGHDGPVLSALAKAAFAPDGAGVSIGPISRFGVLELALPRTVAPLAERLEAAGGGLSDAALALRLLRAIALAAGPGQRVRAVCAPGVADIAHKFAPKLAARIGPRFSILADATIARDDPEVSAQ